MFTTEFTYELLDSLNADVTVMSKKLNLIIAIDNLDAMQKIKNINNRVKALHQEIDDCLFSQSLNDEQI